MSNLRQKLLLGLILGGVIFLNGCFLQNMQAKKYDESGKQALDKGRYEDALEQYRTIVYAYPKSEYFANARKAARRCENELVAKKYFDKAESLYEQKEFACAAIFLDEIINNYPNTSNVLEAKKKSAEYKVEQKAKELFLLAERFFDEDNFWRANNYYKKIVAEYPDSVLRKEAELKSLKCKDKIREYEKYSAAKKKKLAAEKKRREEEERRKAKLDFTKRLNLKVK